MIKELPAPQQQQNKDSINSNTFYYVSDVKTHEPKLNMYGREFKKLFGVTRWSEFFSKPDLQLVHGRIYSILVTITSIEDGTTNKETVWSQAYTPVISYGIGDIEPYNKPPKIMNGYNDMTDVRAQRRTGLSGLEMMRTVIEQHNSTLQDEMSSKSAMIQNLQSDLSEALREKSSAYEEAREEFENQLSGLKEQMNSKDNEVKELKEKIQKLEFQIQLDAMNHKHELDRRDLKDELSSNSSGGLMDLIQGLAPHIPAIISGISGGAVPPTMPMAGIPQQPQPQARKMSKAEYEQVMSQYSEETELVD